MSIQLIPQTPPRDHKWIRQIFSTVPPNGAQLVLHDHSSGLYLPTLGRRSLNVAAVPFDNVVGTLQPDDLVCPVRIVAHISGKRDHEEQLLFTTTNETGSRPTIILEVSSQEAVPNASIGGANIVWLSMKSREAYNRVSDWLKQFLKLSFDDAVEIANASDRGVLPPKIQENYSKLLDITHPGDPASSLAFRILCDAWNEVKVNGKAELSGFPIKAPSDVAEWVAPFKPDGNDDPAKIASVVSKIGEADARNKAKEVLDAVKNGGDPKEPVLAFLGIKNGSAVQSEGGAQ